MEVPLAFLKNIFLLLSKVISPVKAAPDKFAFAAKFVLKLSSCVLSLALKLPAALVVAALIDTVGVAPLVTDIGAVPDTLVTPEPAEIPKFVRAFV